MILVYHHLVSAQHEGGKFERIPINKYKNTRRGNVEMPAPGKWILELRAGYRLREELPNRRNA